MKESIVEINLKEYRVNACMECGRCTAVCPVAATHDFSPRRTLSRGIASGEATIAEDASIWSCLTCRMCENVCPAEIPYSDLNKKIRSFSKHTSNGRSCSHGGLFEQITALMLRPNLKQNRLEWIPKDLKYRKRKGEYLFYTGCSPYFAAYFGKPYSEQLYGSLTGALRFMNKLKIEPVIMSNERCCGHDLLLRGQIEAFKELADKNVQEIKKTGAKKMVFTCPECLTAFREDYPGITSELDIELMHISQLIRKDLINLKFSNGTKRVTYQDPCRLGRYSNSYDQPRDIIKSIPGLELTEMLHNRERAICCGNTAWIGCDAGTKKMQTKRLQEAENTGSEILFTSCPKCLIHLTCSQDSISEEEKEKISIRDLWDYAAESLA